MPKSYSSPEMKFAYENVPSLVSEFHTCCHCLTTGGVGSPPFISASFNVGGLSFLIGIAIMRYEAARIKAEGIEVCA